MTHDHAGLEGKILDLNDAIRKVHDAKHAELLIGFIRRPGWTTVAENELVQAHLENLHSQVSNLHKSLDSLTKAADKVGKK
ncbi:hypothetical protein QEV83_19095 [Methylocapsa sp. D3K7]|uniref:hypothetical protein n=1 Tax=Methylocapsa sp. D3K7 TaxID=3041435 RepID=UPI00244EF45E|nr:hypothetical protein [Methylocapsa sp. D3K7]WGJ14693.1 hypothetical protein QEV83_19095 [Methylocapsa sp. D3K7]